MIKVDSVHPGVCSLVGVGTVCTGGIATLMGAVAAQLEEQVGEERSGLNEGGECRGWGPSLDTRITQ